MLKHFSLRFKLIVAFILVASLVVGGTYYQSRAINRTQQLFSELIENDIARLDAAEEMRFLIDTIYHSALLAEQADLDGRVSGQADLEQLHARLAAEQTKYQSHITTDDQELVANANRLKRIKQETGLFVQQAAEIGRLPKNVTDADLIAKKERFAQKQEELSRLTEEILKDDRMVIAQEEVSVAREIKHATTSAIIAAALPVITALAVGFLVSNSIARRVNRLKLGAQRIANGDFSQSVPVNTQDELGELATTFNQMADRLRDSYGRIALEKQRDEALIQSMAEGVIAVDEHAKVVLINSVAAELLHLDTREQVVDRSLYDVLNLSTAEDRTLTEELHPARIALGMAQAVNDIFMLHTDNHKILLHISASPVIVNEKAAGAIVLLRDVTKEKEVDRMKTEFISLASHQLRTPLSAIKWYTEMLLSGDAGELKPDQKDFAQSVYDSSERMIELVNSLLNISRIESGRIIIDPKPTDLKELVGGIVTDLKAKIEEKNQTLIISVHKDLPKIKLDPRLIGQVYMNLLTNAIKYTPKGGEISVFISKKDDQILSQVTDNGYGIPKSQHAKIFQKFFRAENIVKVETDGTGLGLYLIKAIIESSGGKIWFESEEGKGTTFWFTLPLSGMKPKEGEVTLDI